MDLFFFPDAGNDASVVDADVGVGVTEFGFPGVLPATDVDEEGPVGVAGVVDLGAAAAADDAFVEG